MLTSAPLLVMVDTILYVTPLVADRPRAIDEVIDYFGDPPRSRRVRSPLGVEAAESW